MLHDVNDVHFINLCHVIKQFRLQLVLQQIERAGSLRYDVLFTCNVDKDMFCLIYSASPLQLLGISRNFPLGFTGSALSWRKRTCNNLFTHLCFHLCWCLRATKLPLKAMNSPETYPFFLQLAAFDFEFLSAQIPSAVLTVFFFLDMSSRSESLSWRLLLYEFFVCLFIVAR